MTQPTCKFDIYWDKFFWNNPFLEGMDDEEDTGQHMLSIHLAEHVTKEMLLSKGFVLGEEEHADDTDFFIRDDGKPQLQSQCIPINGDLGFGYGEDEELKDALPEDWEDGVPELIGLPEDWHEGVTLDG